MKGAIFIAASVLMLILASKERGWAQNLVFSRVLLVNISTPPTLDTVPAGKVWKIEAVTMNSNSTYSLLQIGGVSHFLTSTSALYKNLPFWLPSGTPFGLASAGAGLSGKASIIEFNVVP
jgi:hypothetical protein